MKAGQELVSGCLRDEGVENFGGPSCDTLHSSASDVNLAVQVAALESHHQIEAFKSS